MNKSALWIASALVVLSGPAMAQQYDLVISGGRVMDPETMYDGVANVGVTGGKIAAITKDKITGKRTIDAKGLVVAPGFIDTHYHAIDPFGTKVAVADGITTGMDLELGASDVAEWYRRRDQSGWQINYGTTSSVALNRMKVHDPEVKISEPIDAANSGAYINQATADGVPGWSVKVSSVDQMNQVMNLVDEDLRGGALGVGVGAAYMARGMSSYEQFLVQKTAGNYGRLTSVHTRYHLNSTPPTEAPIALDEILANALTLGAPLLLAHDNDYGWWENEEKLRLARERGHNVWGEYYPYDAGSTAISADFLRPESWETALGNKYEKTIYDPGKDKFLTKDEYLKTVAENPGYFVVVFFPWRAKWTNYWLTIPEMVVASDAMQGFDASGKLLPYDADVSRYAGHPRTAGTFSKTLRLGRENGVPLMFTLSQTSYWTAKHLGDTGLEAMKERGRVQVGKVADIVVFDAANVADKSTYKFGENGLSPVGIPYVIVNGVVVKDNGKVINVKAGKSIRFPVEGKGRYKPVDVQGWLNQNTIGLAPTPVIDDTGAGAIEKK